MKLRTFLFTIATIFILGLCTKVSAAEWIQPRYYNRPNTYCTNKNHTGCYIYQFEDYWKTTTKYLHLDRMDMKKLTDYNTKDNIPQHLDRGVICIQHSNQLNSDYRSRTTRFEILHLYTWSIY